VLTNNWRMQMNGRLSFVLDALERQIHFSNNSSCSPLPQR